MTQSALSKRIQSMENELNAKLISTKNKRHLYITESGEVLYRYAQTILAQYDLMTNELAAYRELKKGVLHIGSIPVMSQFSLISGINDFMSDYPQINIVMEEVEGVQLLDQLQAGQFDLGIIRDVQSNLLNASQYTFINLNRDELKIVLPAGHPLAHETSLSIDQLKDYDIAILQSGSGIYEVVNDLFNQAGYTPHIRFTSTHIETLVGVIKDTQRATFLFNNTMKDLAPGEYVALPFKTPIFSTLQIVYPQGSLSQTGRQFVTYLTDHIKREL